MKGLKFSRKNKNTSNTNKSNLKLRYNILTALTYLVGIVLIIQLFNLQIVHGAEYREESNTRLTRESTLEAARGQILDRTGTALVKNSTKFSLELYKTKIDNSKLNESILNIVNLLEKYQVNYVDTLPVKINPYEFTISDENLEKWKKNYSLDAEATAEEAFNKFKEKYSIENTDISEVRKIMAIRYAITTVGYSSTKALQIAEDIPREAVAELSENSDKFPGINIVTKPVRQYTSGTLAAHILGYASKISSEEYEKKKNQYNQNDIIGKSGIEYVFEDYLKGKNGTKQIDMAVDGTITSEYTSKEAVAGSDIVLTIDSKLQKITEEALESNIKKIASGGFGKVYNAKAGSCVVMNVKTGEVLAMASYPTYNPSDFVGGISNENWNKYSQNSAKPLMNKAVQNSYPPGSVFKMVTAIAGLQSGAITRNEMINDTGVYKKYNLSWPCWYYTDFHRGHGRLNVSGAIEKSCNYFFYETGDRMGIETLAKYAKYFGLGVKTGIQLPSETSGAMATPEYAKTVGVTWTKGQTINASIGQGLDSFSPLQMAKYVSMLANGGKNIDVSIVKDVVKSDGTATSTEEINNYVNQKLGLQDEQQEDLPIDKQNLNAILQGMKSVTSDTTGTAYVRFKDFGIEVGGKTGSAEAPSQNGKQIVHAWFAGFAPYDDPEIAVVVMVENGGHGNYTAEVVRDVMGEYFGMNTQDVQEDMSAINYNQSFR
ncbi:MAG: penicillin-binding protein 2 [Clostridia bacterium]